MSVLPEGGGQSRGAGPAAASSSASRRAPPGLTGLAGRLRRFRLPHAAGGGGGQRAEGRVRPLPAATATATATAGRCLPFAFPAGL